jgi:hypothetical protein
MSIHLIFESRSHSDVVGHRRWLKEWAVRRREARLRNELEAFFASIDPALARDIGVQSVPHCSAKPGHAACSAHLIATSALSLVSRPSSR